MKFYFWKYNKKWFGVTIFEEDTVFIRWDEEEELISIFIYFCLGQIFFYAHVLLLF